MIAELPGAIRQAFEGGMLAGDRLVLGQDAVRRLVVKRLAGWPAELGARPVDLERVGAQVVGSLVLRMRGPIVDVAVDPDDKLDAPGTGGITGRPGRGPEVRIRQHGGQTDGTAPRGGKHDTWPAGRPLPERRPLLLRRAAGPGDWQAAGFAALVADGHLGPAAETGRSGAGGRGRGRCGLEDRRNCVLRAGHRRAAFAAEPWIGFVLAMDAGVGIGCGHGVAPYSSALIIVEVVAFRRASLMVASSTSTRSSTVPSARGRTSVSICESCAVAPAAFAAS